MSSRTFRGRGGRERRPGQLGAFGGTYDPDKVAVLTIAAADGMGIPLSLADPDLTPARAAQDVMAGPAC